MSCRRLKESEDVPIFRYSSHASRAFWFIMSKRNSTRREKDKLQESFPNALLQAAVNKHHSVWTTLDNLKDEVGQTVSHPKKLHAELETVEESFMHLQQRASQLRNT